MDYIASAHLLTSLRPFLPPVRWAGFPEVGFEDRTKENSND